MIQALAVPRYDIKIFKRFRQLCGRARLLPFSHILPEKLIQTSENPVASGGFCDVWEGIYHDKWVAIKALRIYKEDDVRKVTKVTYPALPISLRRLWLTVAEGYLQGGCDLEADLTSKYRPVPGGFRGARTPLYGI